jgi:4-aminobutyrate aminotransferase-like enzyme
LKPENCGAMESKGPHCARVIEDLLFKTTVPASECAAIVVEPIQGEGGMNVPDDAYLPGLRQLCDQRDLLLILDEVWTGCGRTGRYFAHQHWGIEPDIMTLAKGVGGGLPVGVMCAKPHVAELYDWSQYGKAKHATTLGGNCIAMAAAATVFKVLQRDGLVERADQLGRRTLQRLSRLIPSCPAVKAVRGKGLFIGIELDPAARDTTFKTAGDVVKRCLDLGVIIQSAQKNVLRLAPPLTISESQLDEGLAVIERALQGA